MYPAKTLQGFDRFLASRGLRLDAIVVGGTALSLLGVITRQTRDCLALAPTAAELADALLWLEVQDLNPDWPAHVRATLADLARRLGHGV